MFKVGNYYISGKGHLVKILSEFKFQNGYNFIAAVYKNGTGWVQTKINLQGKSETTADYDLSIEDTFDSYLTFCQVVINYKRETKKWGGIIYDKQGMTIVSLTDIESQERTLKLLQLGAQEKLLGWMQESGYVDELDDGAA